MRPARLGTSSPTCPQSSDAPVDIGGAVFQIFFTHCPATSGCLSLKFWVESFPANRAGIVIEFRVGSIGVGAVVIARSDDLLVPCRMVVTAESIRFLLPWGAK